MEYHDLKCWPEYFVYVRSGAKTAELRKDDRGFEVGDILFIKEWDPATQQYTGRQEMRRITHIVRGTEHLAPGYAMLSMERC